MSRPTIYSDDLANIIFTRMAEGESLRAICRDDGLPGLSTVFRWLTSDSGFREQYEIAMKQRASALFEEIFEISDYGNEEDTQRAKLRVDTRKWALSKMDPKRYGDATLMKMGDSEGNNLQVSILKFTDDANPVT